MKRILLITALAALSTAGAKAQNFVYFHEGFTNNPGTFNSSAPADGPDLAITYQQADSGVWVSYGFYRTTGGPCPGLDVGHLRSIKTAAGSGRIPFIATPVASFGINEFHFIPGSDNNKTFTIEKTSDTAANTTNWTTIATFVAEPCGGSTPDTTILVNDLTARRIRVLAKENYQVQLDSVWMTSMIPILPITFGNVRGYQRSGGVQIEFENLTETNMAKYVIERSADGVRFEELTSIIKIGNNNNNASYSYFDATPLSGANFYRIKGVEKDGNFKYSSLVKVAVGKGKTVISVAPNPVKGNLVNLQVSNMAKGSYTVTMFNNIGQQVFTKALAHDGGSASYQLQLPGTVKAGIYNLQLKDGENVINKKVVVE